MTKIKNQEAYPLKIPIATDSIVGNDSENDGKTVSFQFGSFVDFVNSINGNEVISYTFALNPIGELDENGYGFFLSENNVVAPENITNLSISKKTKSLFDLTPLYMYLTSHTENFIFKIRNASDPNNIMYFNITSIVEDDFQFVFSLDTYMPDSFIGELLDKNVYVFTFQEKQQTESVPDATNTVKGKIKLTGDLGGTADFPTVPTLLSKQNTLVSGTNIKTIEGQSLLGSGNIDLTKSDVGLGNVDNTTDLNKPVSIATQAALNLKENSSNKQNSLATDGTGTKFPTVDAINAAILQTEITLTDATTTVWDYNLGSYANWIIGGNRTLNITNLPSGKVASGMLRMTENATGGFVPTLAGTFIDVSFRVGANDKNLLGFFWDGSNLFWSSSYTGSPQITITTSVSITTATTDVYGNSQKGKNVVIANGSNSINITVNGGVDFVTSYLKHGSGSITFIQGSGRTLVQVDGTAILSGAVGSTATVSSVGTTDYLRISNA